MQQIYEVPYLIRILKSAVLGHFSSSKDRLRKVLSPVLDIWLHEISVEHSTVDSSTNFSFSLRDRHVIIYIRRQRTARVVNSQSLLAISLLKLNEL